MFDDDDDEVSWEFYVWCCNHIMPQQRRAVVNVTCQMWNR